ncbi:hypothetical protein [Clostridium grantii]|uniref:Uncharacterized protein n=1 Tax=Clostridium grantii DSM 8605 TaxID=1121316 RepID=A0A1M5V5G3_9CLOT|nr:hypothetical protein [Clostridium grantii]SHH70492.1 hypothetical protein SAMN02745207_02097 [Clostridium grantii DSM 8605]
MNFKKRYTKFFIVLLLLLVALSTTVFAIPYNTKYYSWSNPSGSYSPDSGSVRIDSYDFSQDQVYVHAYYMRYDDTTISSIMSYYNNNSYYPGIDITDMSDKLTYNGYYSTNYPNPKFDTDDDDWDGKWEETEITVLSPSSIKTSTDYYFDVHFREYSQGTYTGTINITASESIKQFTEYNTKLFNTLKQMSYSTP